MTGGYPRQVPIWVPAIYSLFVIVIFAAMRLYLIPTRTITIGYATPLVLFWFASDRRFLWLTTVAFAVISYVDIAVNNRYENGHQAARLVNFGMSLLNLVMVAVAVHVLIGTRRMMEQRGGELLKANRELASREDEIACQNESLLQSAAKLERQGEQLRVANDQLLRRERTLEDLLDLSRALTVELSHGQTLARICDAMGPLVAGPGTRSAILERRDGGLLITCHNGFGAGGPDVMFIPLASSFASLVFNANRADFIADLKERPELRVPQPVAGQPNVSVLSTPMRVGGAVVGVLEVYSIAPCTWTSEQVALIESLAAQASSSLEAADLFAQVAQERRKFEQVLRTMPIGVVLLEAGNRMMKLNPAGSTLLGLPAQVEAERAKQVGQFGVTVDGQDVTDESTVLSQTLHDGQPRAPREYELRFADGRRATVLYGTAPIRDPAGRVLAAVATLVDITSLKAMQSELDQRRREAEEASIRKTRFLAAISHDVRTPANAISLLAELIRRTASDPAMVHEIPELARELRQSATALVTLLGDVLDVTRFDTGKIELLESDFNLGELITSEAHNLSPVVSEKRLTFNVRGDEPAPLWVRTDRIKLGRILSNLVGNAVKFTEQGGIIVRFGHRPADRRIYISVQDSGIGIAPEHVRDIFDEFFQLRNPERDRNKGNGLGLTICKRLADAMSAELDVTSTPGHGSTFTVILPTAAELPPPQPPAVTG